MNLTGKEILFLGDSITEGMGTSSNDKNYVSVFAELSGAKVKNYGISGTRIARQTGKAGEVLCDRSFLERVAEMDANADVVVVFGGTNDFASGNAKIGDFIQGTNVHSTVLYTFYAKDF